MCKVDDGNYIMSRVCCATRYLQTQSLDSRREYLARWEKRHGSARAAILRAEFSRQWTKMRPIDVINQEFDSH